MPIRLICRHRRFSQRKMEYEVCRIEIKGSTQYKRWRMGQWHRNVFYIFDIVSLSRNNWLQVVSWCHAILPSVTAKTAKYKQKKIRNVKKYIFLEMRISLPHLAKINHWLFFLFDRVKIYCVTQLRLCMLVTLQIYGFQSLGLFSNIFQSL